ncbi:rRNA-binding ribosome biosynthesis protein UTP23 [Rhodotorula paludigena]|uniref:rRNA-binding ribosome biosynthesis protein UTP23 n=1 Tax=Rhodotorula paludigena TaxID=86838 RepID=UPI0031746508
MRQKRTKGSRKVMHLYCSAFGFREPYQMLVDAAFIQSCVKQKFDIQARLHDTLQGVVKPMITQCCMQALYDLGSTAQEVVEVAKGFERRKCNHLKARPEEECLKAMAGEGNKNRYVFATQSLELRQALRKIPGSPIVYIARSVMLLEAPSDQTLAKKHQMETAKLHVSPEELAAITGKPLPAAPAPDAPAEADAAAGGAATDEPPEKRKKKGPKGPNPLSVRKKKAPVQDASAGRPKKRTREDEGGAGEGAREDGRQGNVASMPTRGDGEARKKRKRRRKGNAGGEAGDAAGGDE